MQCGVLGAEVNGMWRETEKKPLIQTRVFRRASSRRSHSEWELIMPLPG